MTSARPTSGRVSSRVTARVIVIIIASVSQRAKYHVFSSKVAEHGDYMVITWPTFLFWVGWPCNHPLLVDSMLNTSNFARGVCRSLFHRAANHVERCMRNPLHR